MSLDKVRVVVVDDHDIFRAGLVAMLAEEAALEIVGEAGDGQSGLRLAHELTPDVVLMDLRMPVMDGITATARIRAELPGTQVLALTVAASRADVTAVLRAGACGFLVKDLPIDDVVSALRAAATGATWLSPVAAQLVLELVRGRPLPAARPPVAEHDLTPRELEVLGLVARGLENDAIAGELQISPMTAKSHVSRILAKLGVSSRVQAAVYAVRAGLDG